MAKKYQIKEEYRGKEITVTITVPGGSRNIALATASKDQIRILGEMGHPFIEEIVPKPKRSEESENK